jgi:hypothetical protein
VPTRDFFTVQNRILRTKNRTLRTGFSSQLIQIKKEFEKNSFFRAHEETSFGYSVKQNAQDRLLVSGIQIKKSSKKNSFIVPTRRLPSTLL